MHFASGRTLKTTRHWVSDSTECSVNSTWEAINPVQTHENRELWWLKSGAEPHHSFAKELSRAFRGHMKELECGAGELSAFATQACSGKLFSAIGQWYLIHG